MPTQGERIKTQVAPVIRGRPELQSAVERATDILADTMGRSAATAQMHWNVALDPLGRELITLTVSDWTGSVGYNFAPEELSDQEHMKLRLHRLWGDLLMVQSHAHLDDLNWQLHHAGEP